MDNFIRKRYKCVVGGRGDVGGLAGWNYKRRDKFRRLATLGSRRNRGARRARHGR